MNDRTTAYIKEKKLRLSLELGKGQTYSNCKPTLYGLGTYPRSSVLAGQQMRVFLEDYDSIDEALADLKGMKFDNRVGAGSSFIPVRDMVAGIPDDSDY